MADFRFVDVDVALCLAAPIFGLNGSRVSTVLQSHVADELQVSDVALVVYPVFRIELIPIRTDRSHHMGADVGIGQLIGASVGSGGGKACVDGGLAHCDLTIL